MKTLSYEQRKRYHVSLLHIIDEYSRQYVKDFCLSDAIVKEIEQKSLARSNDRFSTKLISWLKISKTLASYVRRGIPSRTCDFELKIAA